MELRLKDLGYTDRFIRGILERVNTVAIVGASLRDVRPSYFVVRYLVSKGYEVYPINPKHAEVQGHKAYPDLDSLGKSVDLAVIGIFARSRLHDLMVGSLARKLLPRLECDVLAIPAA